LELAPREVEQPRTDYEADSAPAIGTAAFGPLYKQHFDGLYDFVARMVRDQDLAGEIVQNTFTKAWDELRAGHELRHPKAWLYIVARNGALDELRRRSRLAGEPLVYAKADPSRLADPQAVAEDNELVELVWTSAAALTPDEYALLDMHVRRGFDAEQLADALELERGAVYTRLSRLRNSLEESVASTLLVRRGRERCPELACIVAEHQAGDKITPALRRAVHDHVRNCDICADTRRRAVSPVALFGALIPVVPLAGMREGILGGIVGSGGHAAAAGAAGGGAAVAATRHGSKARYLAPMGAVAAVGAIVAVALSSGAHVADPAQASSVDHKPGVASSDRTVSMRWLPGKNAKGYSVMFSRTRSAEPPARENVTGTTFTSQPLGPGRWWFILRTHGRKGGWTDTLRVGPFVITAPVAVTQPPAVKGHPKKRAARKATHRHVAASRASKRRAALVAAARSAPAQPVSPQTSTPAGPKAQPKAKAKPKAKPKPKSKGKPPPKSHPPPGTSPPGTSPPGTAPPATTSPPVGQPVSQTPPVVTPPGDQGGGKDDENDGDEDDQGQDHNGNGGKGHGGEGQGNGQGGD
jgi:RNA polymerase sigma factor (sigma-70 family)